MQKGGWVYMMSNRRNGTLYLGVTSSLSRRVWQHREALIDGFTKTYGLKRLVYYEWFDDIRLAIQRERNLKHWSCSGLYYSSIGGTAWGAVSRSSTRRTVPLSELNLLNSSSTRCLVNQASKSGRPAPSKTSKTVPQSRFRALK